MPKHGLCVHVCARTYSHHGIRGAGKKASTVQMLEYLDTFVCLCVCVCEFVCLKWLSGKEGETVRRESMVSDLMFQEEGGSEQALVHVCL